MGAIIIGIAAGCGALVRPHPPVAVFTSDVCVGHDPGWLHPESPKRLEKLLTAMRSEWTQDFGDQMLVVEPEADVTEEQLLRVHSSAHLALTQSAFRRVGGLMSRQVNLDADTKVSLGSAAAAIRAAGLVVAAVDEVLSNCSSVRRAFVMARPPGHHASADLPMGFCIYNNVMVGVAHAQAVHGMGRVAILDFDVHHGNGDESLSWADPSRLYASSHQSPSFPGTGRTAGRQGAQGQVWNCPLPAGSGSQEFRDAWQKTLLPAVRAFEPEAIFLSAGFDAHAEDPMASMALTDDDFAWITTEVAALGDGQLPIISVLEGGYNIVALERAVRRHVGALIDA